MTPSSSTTTPRTSIPRSQFVAKLRDIVGLYVNPPDLASEPFQDDRRLPVFLLVKISRRE